MRLTAALLLVAAAAAMAAPGAAAAAKQQQTPLQYAAAHNDSCAADLLQLAAFPSVSALPEHLPDIEAAAAWLAKRLMAAGLEHVQVLPTGGPQPVVYADWLHAGPSSPTLLIYGHYDVQPADPLELWDSPPFKPALRADGYFYGRGVDDDKGGLLNPVHAVEAFLKTAGKLPLNVKFLLEGQEEIGSPNLEAFLKKHKEGLLAGIDVALSADGGQISATQPGILTGLRGAVALEVTVTTAGVDMHSGLKGGSVQNANHALVQLLGTLKDERQRVAVAGFYSDVVPMTWQDRDDVKTFTRAFDAAAEQDALGIQGYMGEEGYNMLEQRWHRPTLEVVGMWGGFTGAGMKTVIPAKASAKISCRLVPGQDPDDVTAKVRDHLLAHAPPLTRVSVQVHGFRSHPWVSGRDSATSGVAAAVLEAVMGAKPLFYRDGGTIPALAYFQQVLGIDSTVFAFGLGERIHAPNERLLAAMFHTGRLAWVRLLDALADSAAGKAGAGKASAGADEPAEHDDDDDDGDDGEGAVQQLGDPVNVVLELESDVGGAEDADRSEL